MFVKGPLLVMCTLFPLLLLLNSLGNVFCLKKPAKPDGLVVIQGMHSYPMGSTFSSLRVLETSHVIAFACHNHTNMLKPHDLRADVKGNLNLVNDSYHHFTKQAEVGGKH